MAKFKYWIIVDEHNCPMAWSGDQLCYCTNSDWQDDPHPIQLYTLRGAKQAIKKTKVFRQENGYSTGEYKLMPVKPQ